MARAIFREISMTYMYRVSEKLYVLEAAAVARGAELQVRSRLDLDGAYLGGSMKRSNVLGMFLCLAIFSPSRSVAADSEDLETRVARLEWRVATLEAQLRKVSQANEQKPANPREALSPIPPMVLEKTAEISHDEFASLPVLLSQMRAVPWFHNGEIAGTRVFAIRENSLFAKIGLRSGDIVLKVNGDDGGKKPIAVAEALRAKNSGTIELVSDGTPITIKYSIREVQGGGEEKAQSR